MSRPAVFLDRDGTLIEEHAYLHEPERVALMPQAAAALSRLARAGFALVMVTNQAGVARGFYGEDAVERVHRRVRKLLADQASVTLDGVYYCPHHADGVVARYARACRCRKPAPGMLEAAARDLGLDLAASYLVGNGPADMGAARAAGVTPLFVTTGQAAGWAPPPGVAAFPSLAAAADAMLSAPERAEHAAGRHEADEMKGQARRRP